MNNPKLKENGRMVLVERKSMSAIMATVLLVLALISAFSLIIPPDQEVLAGETGEEGGGDNTFIDESQGDESTSNIVAEGTFSSEKGTVVWTLEEDSPGSNYYILTFSGNGIIGDNAPWRAKLVELGATSTSTERGTGTQVFYNISEIIFEVDEEGKTGIIRIGKNVFTNTCVESLIIPEGVEEIGSAFTWSNWLTSISIPSTVTKFDGDEKGTYNGLNGSFYLEEIIVSEGNPRYAVDGGCLVYKMNDTDWAILDCPDQLKKEGKLVTSISASDFNRNITSVAGTAFNSCRSLEIIELPDTVNTIGVGAFNKCISMKTFKMPAGVTEFSGFFHSCELLESIDFNNTVRITSTSPMFKTVTMNEVGREEVPVKISDLNLSEITYISSGAFKDTKSLRTVTFNSTAGAVVQIGSEAFVGCSLQYDTLDFRMYNDDSTISLKAFDAGITVLMPPIPLEKAVAAVVGNGSDPIYYKDFMDAYKDSFGYTLQLCKDVIISSYLTIPKDVTITLDLNGHALIADGCRHFVLTNSNSKLIIKDSNPDLEHTYVTNGDGLKLDDSAENGTVIRGGVLTGGYHEKNSGGSIVVNDGTKTTILIIECANFIGNETGNANGAGAINYSQGGGMEFYEGHVVGNISPTKSHISAPVGFIYGGTFGQDMTSYVSSGYMCILNAKTGWYDVEPIEYTVQYYYLDGGNNHEFNPQKYTIEDDITLCSPVKDGSTFCGWYSDELFEKPIFTLGKGSYGNLELYAKWSQNTSGTNGDITWSYEKGVLTISPITLTGGGIQDYGYGDTEDRPWKDFLTVITKIQIDDNVNAIGNNAFRGMVKLESVNIPASVKNLGDYIFEGDISLVTVSWDMNIQVNIRGDTDSNSNPEDFEGAWIPTSMFDGCRSLGKGVELSDWLPDYFVGVGCASFRGTQFTVDFDEWKDLAYIGAYAFSGMPNLNSFTLKSNITMGLRFGASNAFTSSGLKNITIETASIPVSIVRGCTDLESVTLKNVVEINDNTFQDLKSLKEITIPNTVSKIGKWAFIGCSSLEEVTIGSSHLSFTENESVFGGCSSLTEFIIASGSSVTISYDIFKGSDSYSATNSLKSVRIFGSLTLGEGAANVFTSFSGLKDVTINGCNSLLINDNTFPNVANLTIVGDEFKIRGYSFDGNQTLKNVLIDVKSYSTDTYNDGSKDVSDGAFRNAKALETITIKAESAILDSRFAWECVRLRAIDLRGCGSVVFDDLCVSNKVYGQNSPINKEFVLLLSSDSTITQSDLSRIGLTDSSGRLFLVSPGVEFEKDSWAVIVPEGAHCVGWKDISNPSTFCQDISQYGKAYVSTVGVLEKVDRIGPTCTDPGTEEHWHCTVCGKLFSDSRGNNSIDQPLSIEPLGHTPSTIKGKPATCTGPGLTDASVCSVCGEILIAQTTIPVTGHTIVKVVSVESTCTEVGMIEHWRCSECGALFSDEAGTTPLSSEDVIAPAKGHASVALPGKPAGIGVPGYTDGTECSICHTILSGHEVIPALPIPDEPDEPYEPSDPVPPKPEDPEPEPPSSDLPTIPEGKEDGTYDNDDGSKTTISTGTDGSKTVVNEKPVENGTVTEEHTFDKEGSYTGSTITTNTEEERESGNTVKTETVEKRNDTGGTVSETTRIESVSQDGSVRTDVVIEKDGAGNSSTSSQTVITVPVSDGTAVLDSDSVGKAVSQIGEVTSEGSDRSVTISAATNGSEETTLVIPSDSMKAISDTGAEISVGTKGVRIDMSSGVVDNLSSKGGDVEITVGDADKTKLTEQQIRKVGDAPVLTLSAKVGDESVHQLGGKVTVTIPYILPEGQNPNSVKVYYVDDGGKLTQMETKYDAERGVVEFETNHFSYYMIGDDSSMDEPVDEGSKSDMTLIVGAAVIVAAIACIGAAVMVRRR